MKKTLVLLALILAACGPQPTPQHKATAQVQATIDPAARQRFLDAHGTPLKIKDKAPEAQDLKR